LRHAMREQGLKEVRFRFEFEGTRIISHQWFCWIDAGSDSRRGICNSPATADRTYSESADRCAFRRSGQQGIMTVYRNDGAFDSSNVETRELLSKPLAW